MGDYVKIGDIEGIIRNISSTYTRIIHNDGNTSIIPNLKCLNANILNYTWDISKIQSVITKSEQNLEKSLENLEKKSSSKTAWVIEQLRREIKEQKLIMDEIQDFNDKLDDKDTYPVEIFSEFVQRGKIVRYVFTVSLKKKYKNNIENLNKVCNVWAKEFNFRPQWELRSIKSHFNYQITIITPDPMDIVRFHDDFMTDIYGFAYGH
jgi:hypothetical protein